MQPAIHVVTVSVSVNLCDLYFTKRCISFWHRRNDSPFSSELEYDLLYLTMYALQVSGTEEVVALSQVS